MPGPGGPRGGHGPGGFGGPMGGRGHGPGGFGGPMGGPHGHGRPPMPPHHGFGMGHRPPNRGCGCSGCLMPVITVVGIIVAALAMVF